MANVLNDKLKILYMFFHEDDYCQIQLTPIENLDHLKDEAEKINGFVTKNFDGAGFKDIYIRVDEPKKLSEKRIGINDIEPILAKSEFSRVDNVITGYGSSHREACNNTIGYGRQDCAVLYDFENEIVEHIWLLYHWGTDTKNKERLSKSLVELGQRYNLILMDWNKLVLTDLRDKNAVDEYLNYRE